MATNRLIARGFSRKLLKRQVGKFFTARYDDICKYTKDAAQDSKPQAHGCHGHLSCLVVVFLAPLAVSVLSISPLSSVLESCTSQAAENHTA